MNTNKSRQAGAGMVGLLLALPPLLALGMGGVELAHWMHLRQAISLILTDAARVGATRQANPQAIASAFESGLRQLYIQPDTIQQALAARRQALGTSWIMHIVQPNPAAFQDHADPDVVGTRQPLGQALIRNDYQAQQHAQRQAQGWPQGRGPQSGLNIHEANTLVINLWWPQRPMVPGIAAILQGLAPLNHDPVGQQMMTQGYLPIRRQVRMVMQSHPADWPALADGRIRYATATGAPEAIALTTGAEPSKDAATDSTSANPDVAEDINHIETGLNSPEDPLLCGP
ncbi:hypothetical protein [Castellaniella sp.]|uniref:hypothetical protein n=1 Tax=Castellaniella sp. TaxID=1955812 RepID=UPI002B000A11|nr:hypothetical protein [Castellaniella sp.]